MRRWLKFNAAGAAGVAVQLLTLTFLKSVLKLHYLAATAIAVEAAILQNFVWHQRFTWADRARSRPLRRFVKFNLATGVISILGNVAVMTLLVGRLHLNFLLSNAISIAACSIGNFLASDRLVFRDAPAGKAPPLDCAQGL